MRDTQTGKFLYLAWSSKKKKKTQHATGEQDAKSKTRILVQISYFFFTLFQNPGL